ncbi:transposase [Streptomyces sp. NPDC006691]|uniref:transposase n=1 Tax=Streptomyces sp. NPDC006691 TaxID=3364757 RepID=UPI0036B3024E
MFTTALRDAEWARRRPCLPKNVVRGGRWKCYRRMINGILFRLRTGIPWRRVEDQPSGCRELRRAGRRLLRH